MKKVLSMAAVLVFALCFSFKSYASDLDAVNISAESAILINAGSGEVLFEKNADSQMLIASTTKIMTAVVVLDNCSLDDMVEITSEAAGVEGSSIYLKVGEKLTVRELLYGLMLNSGNDAAAALAIHTSGSIEKFAEEMNKKAAEIGLTNSSFKNPHGLDADGHYSTARDMAKLTAYALENKDFKDIVSTKTATVGSRTLTNHNKLLWNIEGAIGVKTGYTKAAGRILVSAVERDGERLICVTLNDPDDWTDHTNLYAVAYDEMVTEKVCSKGEVFAELPVISGCESGVNIVYSKDVSITVSEDAVIETQVDLPEFVYASVKAGDKAGSVTYYVEGEEKATVDLVFDADVEIDDDIRLNFFEKIRRLIRLSFKYGNLGYSGY